MSNSIQIPKYDFKKEQLNCSVRIKHERWNFLIIDQREIYVLLSIRYWQAYRIEERIENLDWKFSELMAIFESMIIYTHVFFLSIFKESAASSNK